MANNDCQSGSNKRKSDRNEQHGKGKRVKLENDDVLSSAPRELKILDYVKSHVSEINHLQNAIQRDYIGKTAMQKLPRHLQRRAMCHNIKRMPRSVREYAKAHYENQPAKKKFSRYHRRRPRNLLQEYTRRRRKHVWLETHIWHAKRFHMVEKWGHKIPLSPTDKSHRACYRAIKRHCLLQDLSYMCCVEIVGDRTSILQALSHVTSTKTGFTFAAKSCQSGTREGHTVLYECDKYPYGAIGPVSFIWKPHLDTTRQSANTDQSGPTPSDPRQLWAWCHPSCFSQVWQQLEQCMYKVGTATSNGQTDGDKTENEKPKNANSPAHFSPQPVIVNCTGSGSDPDVPTQISMKSLAGEILRYRLTGPQSIAVLCRAIQQASIVSSQTTTDETKVWWKSYFAKEEMALAHGAQRELIEKIKECQSPSELHPFSVMGLTVKDPRLTRPERRTKIEADETAVSGDVSVCQEKITPDIAASPLWNTEIRTQVTASKLPDYTLNEMKSENLIPGTALDLGDEEARVPVLLIQRPGSTAQAGPRHACGSGLDILLPKGWGMPVWLSLVFCGARCGGLTEGDNVAFEEGSLVFPAEYPDTPAGQAEMDEIETTTVAKYNRRPPAKRVNYSKYGVVSPFRCPWNLLIKEWCSKGPQSNQGEDVEMATNSIGTDTDKIDKANNNKLNSEIVTQDQCFVLRDAKLLRQLQGLGQSFKSKTNAKTNLMSKMNEVMTELEIYHKAALVQVQIDMVQRGSVGQFATICIPSKADIQAMLKDKEYGGPLEPKHIDPHQVEKKILKNECKEKGIKKKIKIDRTMTVLADKKDVSVLNGSRDVVGYLTFGGYSLGQGNGSGKGFVSCLGLTQLRKRLTEAGQTDVLVLVRSNCSFQYRFARLSFIS